MGGQAAQTSLSAGPLTHILPDELAAPPSLPCPGRACSLGLRVGLALLPSWATEWSCDLGYLGGLSCTLVSCPVKWGQQSYGPESIFCLACGTLLETEVNSLD